jgi:tetratricopeptide (TPR) repeat protein
MYENSGYRRKYHMFRGFGMKKIVVLILFFIMCSLMVSGVQDDCLNIVEEADDMLNISWYSRAAWEYKNAAKCYALKEDRLNADKYYAKAGEIYVKSADELSQRGDNFAAAREYYYAAEYFNKIDDLGSVKECYIYSADSWMKVADEKLDKELYQDALTIYIDVVDYYKQANDTPSAADTYTMLAYSYLMRNDSVSSKEYAQEALNRYNGIYGEDVNKRSWRSYIAKTIVSGKVDYLDIADELVEFESDKEMIRKLREKFSKDDEEPGEPADYLSYIVILIVIILIAFLIYRKRKISRETEKEDREYEIMKQIRERLKDGADPEDLKKELGEKGYSPELVDREWRKLYG